jgi:hypothetical protein
MQTGRQPLLGKGTAELSPSLCVIASDKKHEPTLFGLLAEVLKPITKNQFPRSYYLGDRQVSGKLKTGLEPCAHWLKGNGFGKQAFFGFWKVLSQGTSMYVPCATTL